MCGIAGIINRQCKELKNGHELDKMLNLIRHRGPDDTGVCGLGVQELSAGERVGDMKQNVFGILGFNRLSIQDITNAGHQPMLSLDQKVVLTFNGEIYNVKELRAQLVATGRYQFRGMSDTEVILNLYLEYGFEDAIQRLNGMFAIVLYDSRTGLLHIARDRFGIIPLHLLIDNNKIVYASEIKCFLALSEFDRIVNPQALNAGAYYCYPNDSMYKGVVSAKPGFIVTWNRHTNTITETKYFDINRYRQMENISFIDSLEKAEALVKKCVERQTISDVNVGVQLSGGVDSTLVAGYVSDLFAREQKRLYGFSLTNHGSAAHDEEYWIDHATKYMRIEPVKFDMNINVFCKNFEKSIYAYERFVSIPSPIGIYEFAQNARNYVTVLLSGEGADELAGGYGSFSECKIMEKLCAIPYLSQTEKLRKRDSVHGTDDLLLRWEAQLTVGDADRLLTDFSIYEILQERHDFWNKLDGTPFDKMRKMHFNYMLISLLERQNKICMASSVENRVPFLDNELVDFMFTIPENQLMHRQLNRILHGRKIELRSAYEGKYILKRLSEKRYGNEFAFRKKQAIRVPLADYLMTPKFQDYVENVLLQGMRQRGFIHVDTLKDCYKNIHVGNNAMMVWKAVNMEAWCQLFIDGREPIEL